jgi:MoxR-like ATPase
MDPEHHQAGHGARGHAPRVTDLQGAARVIDRIRQRLRAAIRGRDDAIEILLIALLADGHVLLEDFPGSGKTTLAKALGDSIIDENPSDEIVAFRRIQFTPDLLPSDITGTTVFEPKTGRFSFRPGPIFAHVLLADEINRTSPKVQSAMLEAMAEKQTTIDNRTHKLDDLFFVIATQNPLDLAGTFPLPAAQLDRFLFKVRMTHISREAELDVLASYKTRRAGVGAELLRVTRSEIIGARAVIEESVHIAPEVRECLVDIAGNTRSDPRVLQGASTRSLVLVLPALQARAVSRGRDFVTAEDVEALAHLIFSHRLELAPGEDSVYAVIDHCLAEPLERLARATMRP